LDILTNGIPLWAVAGYFFFMALVGAMPKPPDGGSMWYQFVYSFLHILSANIKHATDTIIKKDKIKKPNGTGDGK